MYENSIEYVCMTNITISNAQFMTAATTLSLLKTFGDNKSANKKILFNSKRVKTVSRKPIAKSETFGFYKDTSVFTKNEVFSKRIKPIMQPSSLINKNGDFNKSRKSENDKTQPSISTIERERDNPISEHIGNARLRRSLLRKSMGKTKEYNTKKAERNYQLRHDRIERSVNDPVDSGKICASVYSEKNFKGKKYLLCKDDNPIEVFQSDKSFPDNSISSLEIPDNHAMKLCKFLGGNGRCRTYYSNAPDLGYYMDNLASHIELFKFDFNNFTMAFMSDPQYPWSCINFGESCSNTTKATIDNYRRMNSLNHMAEEYGISKFAGVVINGDLTSYGHPWQLYEYRKFYENDDTNAGVRGGNVYPGLGNHDYENNIDDCWRNRCASWMMHYMMDHVATLNPISFDYKQSDFLLHSRTYSGSFGYSWDIGDIHFVQMNNYPRYKTNWYGYSFTSARTESFNIEPSISWLDQDLSLASQRGKYIVLNYHRPENESKHGLSYTYNRPDIANDPEYEGILKKYKVSAIFAGHHHREIGTFTTYNNLHGKGEHLPIFLGGSVPASRYLITSFNTKNKTYSVSIVDDSNPLKNKILRTEVFRLR